MVPRSNIEVPSTADLVFEESVSLEPPDTKTLNLAALGGPLRSHVIATLPAKQ